MKPVHLLMDAPALDRALTRITHEILERNRNLGSFGVVGMQTRGVHLAQRIVSKINALEKTSLQAGILDITLYRDDYRLALRQPKVQVTNIPFDIADMTVLLVDDVLFTGRTIRAALDALMDFGRPQAIELAVLIDRGHRQMPIHADYVGKKLETSQGQAVLLRVNEIDGEDCVWLTQEQTSEVP